MWWTTINLTRRSRSLFVLSSQPQTFPSRHPTNIPVDLLHVESAVNVTFPAAGLQSEQWNRVAKLVARRRQLRLAILGCSTSVGCGSADPSPRCDASRGWPRLFHDAVQGELGKLPGWMYGVHTRVTAKNAVDPTYFAQCTTSFVDDSTHVVLVEFFTNMFGLFKQGNRTGLDATIEAIRMAAPNAAVVFVVWLKEVSSPISVHLRSAIRRVAKRQRVDVVDLPIILFQMRHRKVPVASWYANRGLDHHPNGPGHWLLATAAAHLVVHRLAEATPLTAVLSVAGTRHTADMYCADCIAKRLIKRQVCHNTASTLPLRMPLVGSWTLVDEGGDKGVSKPGYVSTVIGDVAELVVASPLCPLGSSLIRLGYHLSSRPGQGALNLSCIGCTCQGLQGILSTVSPFPIVETDTRLMDPRYFSMPDQATASLSVTASTSFTGSPHPGPRPTECVVRVKHVASSLPRSERSRIRLDSMAVQTKCPLTRPKVGQRAARLPDSANPWTRQGAARNS